MINLTKINRTPIILNSDLIEFVESTPDTVITLTSSQKILVLEKPDEIIERVIEFRRAIAAQPYVVSRRPATDALDETKASAKVMSIHPVKKDR